VPEVDGQVDQRGQDHAAECGRDRDEGGRQAAHLPSHELALQLESGDKEEDGQQPVCGPFLQAQVQQQGGRADREVPEMLVPRPRSGVGQDERSDRGGQQQRAAHRLGSQRISE